MHRGRSQAHPVRKCCIPLCPQRTSRKGEFQPTFVGENFQHALWLKQIRRIQSLVKLLGGKQWDNLKADHDHSLWMSIRSAQGFPGGFSTFWQDQTFDFEGVPVALPHSVPALETTESILRGFETKLKHLERVLHANRVAFAKTSRVNDLTKIYKDVARPKAVPVQTLVSSRFAQVSANNPESFVVSYPEGTLEPDEPVFGPHGLLSVTSHDPGQIQCSEDQDSQKETFSHRRCCMVPQLM